MKILGRTVSRTQLIKAVCLILVCLLAFSYYVFFIEASGKYSEDYMHDEGNYIAMAKRLVAGEEYSYWGEGSDAYVSPGFPLFLTVCMSIFGTDVQGIHCIKAVQCVLATFTVLLTFILGYQLTRKYSVGIIAAILIALNGGFGAYCRYLLTECLYYFTMMLFFVVFVYTVKHQERRWLYFLSGALFCVCVMVRPLIIIVTPFLFLPGVIRNWKQWRKILIPIGLFAAGFVLLALPWWIRNLVTLGKFVPLATQTNPIYAGLAPDVAALGLSDPGSLLGNIKLLFRLLIEHPFQTIYWMTVGKFQIIFMDDLPLFVLQSVTAAVKDIALYVGLVGALCALLHKRYRWPTILFFVYFLSSFLFVPVARYALQYMPFLAIYAGYVATVTFQHLRANGEVSALRQGQQGAQN